MHRVDVTEDACDAYSAWVGSRDLDDTPPPLIPFWITTGAQIFVDNIRLGNTTADNQFIYSWPDDTTVQTLDVTAFGDTNRTFLSTLRYNEI